MKTMILAVAALATFVSAAGAADLPPREAVRGPAVVMPPPARNWTGCYLGGGFGYGMWNQENTAVSGGAPLSAQVTAGGRGYLGTAQFGCDYQAGNFVVGAFGDGDFGSLKGNASFNTVYGEEKEKWSWAAGARVGYLVTPQLLGFFSAGYTQAHFDQVNLLLLGSPGVSAGLYIPQTTYSGWFLGSGYEYGISWWPGLFWKTEYRFSDFSSERIQILNTSGSPSSTGLDTHKYIQTIRSELVWRF